MAPPAYKGIYALTINGKSYIGQDSAIMKNNRFRQHLVSLKGNHHNNTEMQDDFNTFGMENLTYTILEVDINFTKEDLNNLEQKYIEKYNTYYSGNGYNQTSGGIGMTGFVMTPETLELKSKNIRGEDNPQSKLTNEQFFEIVDLLKNGKTNDEIAEEYNLHTRYVSLIRHKKRYKSFWKQIKDYDPIQSHSLKDKRRLNYEDFLNIVDMIKTGETNAEIQRRYEFSSGTGSRIRHRKLYKDYWEKYDKDLLINK